MKTLLVAIMILLSSTAYAVENDSNHRYQLFQGKYSFINIDGSNTFQNESPTIFWLDTKTGEVKQYIIQTVNGETINGFYNVPIDNNKGGSK